MKPVNSGGHAAYQNHVLTQLRKYYPDAPNFLPASTWQIIDKFWNLDLSDVDELMQDRYSSFGPRPRLASDMLRSILVSVEFKITSYTKLAADLKENYLHAIILAFFLETPPVSVLFMTSIEGSGFPIKNIYQILFIRLKSNLLSQMEMNRRLLLLKM